MGSGVRELKILQRGVLLTAARVPSEQKLHENCYCYFSIFRRLFPDSKTRGGSTEF